MEKVGIRARELVVETAEDQTKGMEKQRLRVYSEKRTGLGEEPHSPCKMGQTLPMGGLCISMQPSDQNIWMPDLELFTLLQEVAGTPS